MKHILVTLTALASLVATTSWGQTANKAFKSNTEGNPILPYNLCADPTAVGYDGRLYVYGTNDQQELETTGNKSQNTYGKITQLVCMSTADMVNWTFHGIIDVKKLSPWISTSWAPSIVSREEADGKTHFYLYYTNTASGIGVLTSTSPTGPWKDPLGKALIYWATPGRGEQSNIIDPGVLIDDNGTAWLTFGGGDPNKNGSNLIPGNARIVKLGKDMISLSGAIKEIPAPFHFEANELNYINGKYVFSYSAGWNCNANDWSNYSGRGSYACPGNCSILSMTTDDPINGTWKYSGEILKNPGAFGYPWGNNHSHLQKFGNDYYMLYHTQYLESHYGISGGYRSMAVNIASVSTSTGAVTASMSNAGTTQITANRPHANQLTEAEMMANCAGIKVKKTATGDCVVTDIDAGDWTMVRGMYFPEVARSVTARIKGKGKLKIYLSQAGGTPYVEKDFDNDTMNEITFDLQKDIAADKAYNIFFLFDADDSSKPVEFDRYKFNTLTTSEIESQINAVENPKATPFTANIIYDVNGRNLKEAPLNGLYIENGIKKIRRN